jgi:hypothetical protein
MKTYIYALALVMLLAACSDVKETVGLGRNTPDEFDVVNNPPLTIPPDFTLRPPERGVQVSAGAVSAVETAAKAAGASIPADAATTPGLAAFLTQANAGSAQPDIRATIDRESDGVVVKDRTFVDKLMVWEPKPTSPDPTINDTAEAARVKAAQDKGGFVSGDGAQYDKTDPNKPKAPLEGLFN